MLFVTFPLLLLLFFCLFDFCQFDYYLSWHVSPWVYPLWDSLYFLDLSGCFLSHGREILAIMFSNIFSDAFSSPSGTPIMLMSVCLILSQTVLFILLSVFCFMAIISTTLSPSSLIHSSASVLLLLIPSSVFFISVIIVFISVFALNLLAFC